MASMEPMNEKRTTPSQEVLEKPERRRFTMEEKTRILDQADACTESGQLGELLRSEGIYSSYLTAWRRQRDEGSQAGLTPKRRGRKAKSMNPLADEVTRLQRKIEHLQDKLRQAELIIDVQKKVSEIMGIPIQSENELNE